MTLHLWMLPVAVISAAWIWAFVTAKDDFHFNCNCGLATLISLICVGMTSACWLGGQS